MRNKPSISETAAAAVLACCLALPKIATAEGGVDVGPETAASGPEKTSLSIRDLLRACPVDPATGKNITINSLNVIASAFKLRLENAWQVTAIDCLRDEMAQAVGILNNAKDSLQKALQLKIDLKSLGDMPIGDTHALQGAFVKLEAIEQIIKNAETAVQKLTIEGGEIAMIPCDEEKIRRSDVTVVVKNLNEQHGFRCNDGIVDNIVDRRSLFSAQEEESSVRGSVAFLGGLHNLRPKNTGTQGTETALRGLGLSSSEQQEEKEPENTIGSFIDKRDELQARVEDLLDRGQIDIRKYQSYVDTLNRQIVSEQGSGSVKDHGNSRTPKKPN